MDLTILYFRFCLVLLLIRESCFIQCTIQHMSNLRKIKHPRYHIFRYDPNSFVDYDYAERLQELADRWKRSHVTIDPVDSDKAIRTMAEQIDSRAEYDWAGHVDISTGVVRIPMGDVVDLNDTGQRYTLTQNGIMSKFPEDAGNSVKDDRAIDLTKEELEAYIPKRIAEWIYVALLYSSGGLVDKEELDAKQSKMKTSKRSHKSNS